MYVENWNVVQVINFFGNWLVQLFVVYDGVQNGCVNQVWFDVVMVGFNFW